MVAAIAERTIHPPTESMGDLVDFFLRTEAGHPPVLIGGRGTRIELPRAVYEAMKEMVLALAAGQAVTMTPHNERLTTQQAADMLGVSRPTLVKMLEDGEIPFEQPGKHRRVLLSDILAFKMQYTRRSRALEEVRQVVAATAAQLRLVVLHEDADFETIRKVVPDVKEQRISGSLDDGSLA